MEDDLPRTRDRARFGAASDLAGESLDSYSQDELTARIALLEAEIERVRAHHERAARQREAADALFSPRETG